MRKLKRSGKALMILEAGYIYCNRHNFDYETFIDNVFMTKEFNYDEFENICKDLRYYRYVNLYKLKEITDDEYEMCLDKFSVN